MAKVDPTFGINDYNRPKSLTPIETTVTNILMLLFGEPGFYPSIPTLGMNINQYLYKFEDEIDTEAIRSELINQCKDIGNSINSSDLIVTSTLYKERMMLLFLLPVITDGKTRDITLGITTNGRGEIIYNFVENKYQII